LLLSDTYLPGALVLAHSLRDAGVSKKLAVLVTLDTVSNEVVTQLKASLLTVYNYVIPVNRIRNSQPANLHLMNRADLHSAFTKIELWKQTQFRKIVYIDSDVVAYRAPDELFDIPHPFSAAPDIGWPDLFNTGVMVLTPNLGDYQAMVTMAENNVSFDGADQGLINQHFGKDYNRLSFSYNVTPSGHYQYVPAYRHFQSSINMVHFIGSNKPWFNGRPASNGDSPYDQMINKWWAVYDKHYGGSDSNHTGISELVQYLTRGEYRPKGTKFHTISQLYSTIRPDIRQPGMPSQVEAQSEAAILQHNIINFEGTSTETPEDQIGSRYQPTTSTWDAQRGPPPVNSRPEAMNFPNTVYAMSRDTTPYVAPRNPWYEMPKGNHAFYAKLPKPIFPWEASREPPSRVFPDDPPPEEEEEEETEDGSETPTHEPSSPSMSALREPATPTTPTIRVTPSDPWSSFTLTNAWDEVPEIERYVDRVQKHQRRRSLKSPGVLKLPEPEPGKEEQVEITWRRRGSKVTDFPSETERPSLPVTPAPVRRPTFWGGGPDAGPGEDENPLLPAAEGVPAQTEWDPVAQLQKLAMEQSEELLRKLGIGSEEPSSPTRAPDPAKVWSPQPVKGGAGSGAIHNIESNAGIVPRLRIPQPSYSGPGAVFEKGENIPTEDTQTPQAIAARSHAPTKASAIPEPSYSGPGLAFDRYDDNITIVGEVE
ncbi:glycosyltransferase family 8 protein, partial [Hypoxylon sp. CI-4A]